MWQQLEENSRVSSYFSTACLFTLFDWANTCITLFQIFYQYFHYTGTFTEVNEYISLPKIDVPLFHSVLFKATTSCTNDFYYMHSENEK